MIYINIKLECSGCGRNSEVTFSKVWEVPNLESLLAGFKWRQYLQGALLCPICADDPEKLSGVQRVMDGWHHRIIKQGADSPVPVNGNGNGNHVPVAALPVLKSYTKVTDEQVNEALGRFTKVSDAARSLGMTYPAFRARINRQRERQRLLGVQQVTPRSEAAV